MASDYHPLYSTLWNDEKLEASPFEARGFFAYLCSNNRVRPSGIYRATDAQLAADTKTAQFGSQLPGRSSRGLARALRALLASTKASRSRTS